jgi:hypothetical protein
MDIVAELARLAELHTAGALTDEEFAAAKARVLASAQTGTADSPAARAAAAAPPRRAAADPGRDTTAMEPDVASTPGVTKGKVGRAGGGRPQAKVAIAAAVVVVIALMGAFGVARVVSGDHNVSKPTAAETAAEDVYDVANADNFAATNHTCVELEEWYKNLPNDNSRRVAEQYWTECGIVPPPVRSFDLEPWDNEGLVGRTFWTTKV